MTEEKRKSSPSMLNRWMAFPYAKRGNIVIMASMVSILLALVVGVPFLTPFLNVLAIALFFYGAMVEGRDRDAISLTVRWVLTTFVVVAIFSVFLPDRARDSMPLAQMMLDSFTRWIAVNGAPAPFSVVFILITTVGFLILSLVSGGLAALLVSSAGICGFAYTFAYLLRHGTNLVLTTLAAIPPWYLFAILAGFLLLQPSARLFYNRVKPGKMKASVNIQTSLVLAGISFLILSIISRLTTTGVWHTFITNSTVW